MEKTPKGKSRQKSKLRDLHIPLSNFKYFHKPSSEEAVPNNFIGREDISEQLEEWLTVGDSGAYLATGYHGMDKTSFVGKVLHKITKKSKINEFTFNVCCFLFRALFVLSVFLLIIIIILYLIMNSDSFEKI